MKKILLSFLLGVPFFALAQVTFSVQLPPAGMIQRDQLWNIVLANNNKASFEASVSLSLRDAVTGQPVLTAYSPVQNFRKGVQVLSSRMLQPIQYDFVGTGMDARYLPLGSYLACYSINDYSERQKVFAEECVRINVLPLSPPLLTSPADKSSIATQTPQLSWIPPAPLDMFSDLTYDLIVTEIMSGQSPEEAITNNTPTYSRGYLKAPYETYPSTFSKLQLDKTYAWQVIARNGFSYAAATEVWTFHIGKDSSVVSNTAQGYLQLKAKTEGTGTSYIKGNMLLLKYYSFDAEHETTLRLVDVTGKLIQERKEKIAYGDNYLRLKLSRAFQMNQLYSVEIADEQRHVYSASFSIQSTTN